MKIRPVVAELFLADGRTDKTKLIVTFRNFPNAPDNYAVKHFNELPSSQSSKRLLKRRYLYKNRRGIACHKTGIFVNHLTPNGHFSGRTTPLTYRCSIFFIYSTAIRSEYFKHAAHSPFFFPLFKLPFIS
jgi:hypothetical protein